MNPAVVTVEEWKAQNSHRLIDCRFGAVITRDACRSYQVRAGRYIDHFVGDRTPTRRMNAEYASCAYPEPCPYLMPDNESAELRAERQLCRVEAPTNRRVRDRQARLREWLTSPNVMLQEPNWNRSLVRKW